MVGDTAAMLRARRVLDEWVRRINEVGMMSAERPYVRELILRHLESKIVAECLVDLLAQEFEKDT